MSGNIGGREEYPQETTRDNPFLYNRRQARYNANYARNFGTSSRIHNVFWTEAIPGCHITIPSSLELITNREYWKHYRILILGNITSNIIVTNHNWTHYKLYYYHFNHSSKFSCLSDLISDLRLRPGRMQKTWLVYICISSQTLAKDSCDPWRRHKQIYLIGESGW